MAKTKSLRLAVSFGGVSIGEATARLGITVDREDMTLEAADKMLCGRRITGWVQASKSDADQAELPGMEGTVPKVKASFDVKGIAVKPATITAGLTFALTEIDVAVLARFAKREGWLICQDVVDLADVEVADDSEVEDE